MSDDTIKLDFADAQKIHVKATIAQTANHEAITKIKSSLAGTVHIGIAGKTADELVELQFAPYFNELTEIISRYNNSIMDGMASFHEVDMNNAVRMKNS